jgi:hypothetical protein
MLGLKTYDFDDATVEVLCRKIIVFVGRITQQMIRLLKNL